MTRKSSKTNTTELPTREEKIKKVVMKIKEKNGGFKLYLTTATPITHIKMDLSRS